MISQIIINVHAFAQNRTCIITWEVVWLCAVTVAAIICTVAAQNWNVLGKISETLRNTVDHYMWMHLCPCRGRIDVPLLSIHGVCVLQKVKIIHNIAEIRPRFALHKIYTWPVSFHFPMQTKKCTWMRHWQTYMTHAYRFSKNIARWQNSTLACGTAYKCSVYNVIGAALILLTKCDITLKARWCHFESKWYHPAFKVIHVSIYLILSDFI